MENNARMDERKKGMRKDLLKTKADVEKEGKEPAAVSVTFVRISTKNVFLWTKTQQFKYDDPFQLFNSVCASGRNWVVGSVIFSDWPFSVLCCIKRAKFEMLLNLSVLLITRLTFYIIFNHRKGRRKCVLRSILPFPFSITLYAQQYICVYNFFLLHNKSTDMSNSFFRMKRSKQIWEERVRLNELMVVCCSSYYKTLTANSQHIYLPFTKGTS